MTHRAGMISLANCESSGGTKTMFFNCVFLPASIRRSDAVIDENLMGMSWHWDNHPGMFQASTFLPAANSLGYPHFCPLFARNFSRKLPERQMSS
jgi:hypothetical protein